MKRLIIVSLSLVLFGFGCNNSQPTQSVTNQTLNTEAIMNNVVPETTTSKTEPVFVVENSSTPYITFNSLRKDADNYRKQDRTPDNTTQAKKQILELSSDATLLDQVYFKDQKIIVFSFLLDDHKILGADKPTDSALYLYDLKNHNLQSLGSIKSLRLSSDTPYLFIDKLSSDSRHLSIYSTGCLFCDDHFGLSDGQLVTLLDIKTLTTKNAGRFVDFEWLANGKYRYKEYIPTEPCEVGVCHIAPSDLPWYYEKNINWCDQNKIGYWISPQTFNGWNHAPSIMHVCKSMGETFYLSMDWNDKAVQHTGTLYAINSSSTFPIVSANIDPKFDLLDVRSANQSWFSIDGKSYIFDEIKEKFITGSENTKTMSVKIMVPKDKEKYLEAMLEYMNVGGQTNPADTWTFEPKTLLVPYTTNTILASANAAALEFPSQANVRVVYLKVINQTAYVLTNIHLDGWAGVSYTLNDIQPLIKNTLLQFPEIKGVNFYVAPEDKLEDLYKLLD